MEPDTNTGLIWDIQRYALHDGPGIRTIVFFKGCPLRCKWCCNPESQSFKPEFSWLAGNCLGCNLCQEVCPVDAVRVNAERRWIDIQRCNFCGLCVERCPGGALTQLGCQFTAEALLQDITCDSIFFQRSGGGLTLSGGEPTSQPAFARELLRRYKVDEYGPHTALETCGYAPWEDLAGLLEYIDVVLYDIKVMDPGLHKKYTGVDNANILSNVARIAQAGYRLILRLPLIPGYTDDEANVQAIADFVRQLPGVEEIHLLPYHRLGESKYGRLGRQYSLEGTSPLGQEQLSDLMRIVEGAGLRAVIGG
jgi:pyruvate formate lyase activating enzyme